MENCEYAKKTMQGCKCKFDLDLRNYRRLHLLGRGSFGRVYLAQHKQRDIKIAAKILKKDECSVDRVKVLRREASNQYRLKHKSILKMYGICNGFGRICLFLEYASLGSLRRHLDNAKKFNDSTASKLAFIIADALHYCHSKKIMHRDLKPDNVLVTEIGAVKLADFGCSALSLADRQQTICGTSFYLAPEMFVGRYNHTVDIWSLGVMSYEFVTGEVPFNGKTLHSVLMKGSRLEIKIKECMSTDFTDFVLKLLRKPTERLPLRGALKHPWIMRYHKTDLNIKNGFIY